MRCKCRLVIDKDTGKTKVSGHHRSRPDEILKYCTQHKLNNDSVQGYAFAEYFDVQTAQTAQRNLTGHEINGRPLRVDFADTDSEWLCLGVAGRLPRLLAPFLSLGCITRSCFYFCLLCRG